MKVNNTHSILFLYSFSLLIITFGFITPSYAEKGKNSEQQELIKHSKNISNNKQDNLINTHTFTQLLVRSRPAELNKLYYLIIMMKHSGIGY